MKHSEFLWTSFAFGHLAANVRVRCSDLSNLKLRVYAVYSNRRLPSLFGEHCKIVPRQTLRKTLKRWWGQLEKWQRQSPVGTKRRRDRGRDRRRHGGDRWGNVYGRRGVLIWWERDGSAWRAAFSCGIVSRFRVWAELRKFPCEWAGQEIPVMETTMDRNLSPSRMMMKAWRVVWVMRRQSQHTGQTLICKIRIRPYGPLIHASGSSA